MRAHRTTDRVFTAAPERAEQIMRVVYARIPARNWPGSTARRTASRAVSSRRLRQEFPDLARPYWRANRLWPGSYFAGPADGAPHLGPAPVHRIAARPCLTGSRPPAFTTGLKADALADNPVAEGQVAGVLDDDVELADVAENRLHRLVGGVLGLHVELDDPQVEAATLRGVEEFLSVRGVAVADAAYAGVDGVTVGRREPWR